MACGTRRNPTLLDSKHPHPGHRAGTRTHGKGTLVNYWLDFGGLYPSGLRAGSGQESAYMERRPYIIFYHNQTDTWSVSCHPYLIIYSRVLTYLTFFLLYYLSTPCPHLLPSSVQNGALLDKAEWLCSGLYLFYQKLNIPIPRNNSQGLALHQNDTSLYRIYSLNH